MCYKSLRIHWQHWCSRCFTLRYMNTTLRLLKGLYWNIVVYKNNFACIRLCWIIISNVYFGLTGLPLTSDKLATLYDYELGWSGKLWITNMVISLEAAECGARIAQITELSLIGRNSWDELVRAQDGTAGGVCSCVDGEVGTEGPRDRQQRDRGTDNRGTEGPTTAHDPQRNDRCRIYHDPDLDDVIACGTPPK